MQLNWRYRCGICIDMNFRHLRTFVAIADAGGIHRAATRLHLSQPAASRQVQALEADLGVTLFDRIGRGLRLTPEGEIMLRRGRRLLAEVEAFGGEAAALTSGEIGVLRVAATSAVIESMLARFIARFRRRHSGIEVQLIETGGLAMPQRLDDGDVHVALMALDDDRFRCRLLHPVYGLAVVAERHRFARRRTLEIAALSDEPLVLLRDDFASRDWFETARRIAGIRPRVLLESSAPHAAIAVAHAGLGVAIVPSTVRLATGRVTGRVCAIPLVQRGVPIGRWLRAAWHPERRVARYVAAFIDELAIDCRQRYPGCAVRRRAGPLPRPAEPAVDEPLSDRRP
jgi:LysR family cyn operon transcriptional activator